MEAELPATRRSGALAPSLAKRAPRASVVIAWSGSRATLERYLVDVSVVCHGFGAELIVVAQQARTGSALLRARFGVARVIGGDGERALERLRARGVRAATGDVVLVLDDSRQAPARQVAAMLERLHGPLTGPQRAGVPVESARQG